MDSLLPLLPIALLVLGCPLGMAGLGVGAWLVARARGEKKELSMSCMGGSCNHQEHSAQDTEPHKLEEEIASLQLEVQTLKAQLDGGRSDHSSEGTQSVVAREGTPRSGRNV